MIQCSIHDTVFAKLYLCGSRTNLYCIIHEVHKICCHTTQNTRNQQVAEVSVKHYIGLLFNR